MFRYERPQANRYRQFYQIGAEAMGVDGPKLDAEIISMLSSILEAIGLKGLNFEITSIGCKECRPDYINALKEFLEDKLVDFCSDCGRRFKTNPLRVLDCKVPGCVKAKKGSPPVVDYLCKDCSDHFDRLKNNLNKLNVPHTINPNLVRGLDYYTKTAFEVSSENLGSQNAVAAGGRYDGMVKEFGGPATSGIGFAIGMERVIPLIKDSHDKQDGPELFMCPLGEEAAEMALQIAEQLRGKGIWVEVNYDNTSIRSQMRKANRINARNVVVIGEDELEDIKITIKNMADKSEKSIELAFNEILKVLQSG